MTCEICLKESPKKAAKIEGALALDPDNLKICDRCMDILIKGRDAATEDERKMFDAYLERTQTFPL